MERKSLNQYSFVFLVEGEKFKLRNLPSRTSSLLCCGANSVGTRLSLQHLAAVVKPVIAELVHSFFFSPQPWILQWSEQGYGARFPFSFVLPFFY